MTLAYILAVVCPPVAVALAGKQSALILNILLCFLGWVPGVIHAIVIISAPTARARITRRLGSLDDD